MSPLFGHVWMRFSARSQVQAEVAYLPIRSEVRVAVKVVVRGGQLDASRIGVIGWVAIAITTVLITALGGLCIGEQWGGARGTTLLDLKSKEGGGGEGVAQEHFRCR